MTNTAQRIDAPDPPEPGDEFEDRHSGVRQLTPRPTAIAAPPARLSMEWLASRLKWVLAVGLAWGFAVGLSLGLVARSPRSEIAVDQSRERLRTPATQQTTAAALVAAPARTALAPIAAQPATTPTAPIAAQPAPVPPAAQPATAAIAQAASDDTTGPGAASLSGWRDAVRAAVEEHDGRVRDCLHHARSREAITPGRVRVTIVASPDGHVRNVGWSDADPSQVRALGCITSAIRRWNLPTFEGEPLRTAGVYFDLR